MPSAIDSELAHVEEILLVLILVAWGLGYLIARKHDEKLRQKGITFKPLVFVVRFGDIEEKIDALVEKFPRLRFLATLGPYVAYVLMLIGIGFLANNLVLFFQESREFVAVTPVIPLVTIQSPLLLLYFFASIPILVIPHELAHAVVARLNRIKLRGGGIAVIALIFAGFVEPDEESFRKASWKARMQVASAGSLANTIVGGLILLALLTQPYTHMYLPSMAANVFYGPPQGVLVVDVVKGLPAERSGLEPRDVIIAVNSTPIKSIEDYVRLPKNPGSSLKLAVLRHGTQIDLELSLANISGKAVAGFYGITYRPPRLALPVLDKMSYSFLLWSSLFSLIVAVFNMLPLYPFDGGLYVTSILDAILKNERNKKAVLAALYAFSAILLGGNIAASIARYGLIRL